jgi:hypothetical protein
MADRNSGFPKNEENYPNFPISKNLLGWPKSSRKSASWGNFYKVPKETHSIFKDFEDEMTSSEKNFLEILPWSPLM